MKPSRSQFWHLFKGLAFFVGSICFGILLGLMLSFVGYLFLLLFYPDMALLQRNQAWKLMAVLFAIVGALVCASAATQVLLLQVSNRRSSLLSQALTIHHSSDEQSRIYNFLNCLQGVHRLSAQEQRSVIFGFSFLILAGPAFLILSVLNGHLSSIESTELYSLATLNSISLGFGILTYEICSKKYVINNETVSYVSKFKFLEWKLRYDEIVHIEYISVSTKAFHLELLTLVGKKYFITSNESIRKRLNKFPEGL